MPGRSATVHYARAEAVCGYAAVVVLVTGSRTDPVAEIGHEIQPAAKGLDVAGDDLEGGDLAVARSGIPGRHSRPWRRRSASDPGPAACGSGQAGTRAPGQATGAPASISEGETPAACSSRSRSP